MDPRAFERKLDEMESIVDRSPEDRAMVRAWASGSTEVELDRQGRVAIPGYLREYARLESAVLIHGAITHIELWDPGGVGGPWGAGRRRAGRSTRPADRPGRSRPAPGSAARSAPELGA